MDIYNLTEEKLKEVKNQLIENGTIIEKNKISKYDNKFFETVTISNTLIKFFIFFSLGVYLIINLVGIVLSLIYNKNNSIDMVGMLVGLFFICFIVFAIFRNINTKKNKEEFVIYIKDDYFIFNYMDGLVENSKLFFRLPVDSVGKIEFIVHSFRKKEIYGAVTFTFNVLDYEVIHSLRFTNLTKIEQFIKKSFPTLISKLIVDGKSKKEVEPTKENKKIKSFLISLVNFIISILLFTIPYIYNYHSISLIIAGITLMLSTIVVFVSPFLYTYHLVNGAIISGVFIIIGYCVPLLIIEISGISVIDYVIQDTQILMPTIFGVIGSCLYIYIFVLTISKLHYMFITRNNKEFKF